MYFSAQLRKPVNITSRNAGVENVANDDILHSFDILACFL